MERSTTASNCITAAFSSLLATSLKLATKVSQALSRHAHLRRRRLTARAAFKFASAPSLAHVGDHGVPLPKIQRCGDYLVTDQCLGTGAFAQVFLGFHARGMRQVAVKAIRPEKMTRKTTAQVKQEVAIMRKLSQCVFQRPLSFRGAFR